jgi:aminopeptidase N
MSSIFIKSEDVSKFDFIIEGYDKMPMSQEKFDEFPQFAAMLLKVKDLEQFRKGVDALVRFRDGIPASQKEEISKLLNDNFLKPIGERKQAAGMKDQADYILSKIPK